MKYEDVSKILKSHENIVFKPAKDIPGELNRDFNFVIENQEYTIEWWKNLCYLRFGNSFFMFYSFKISPTWPNDAYKLNLQFYNKDSNTVGVIPLEKYSERKVL